MNLSDFPHRRLNPLTGEYVLVSPHRSKRPWLGKVENAPPTAQVKHDPNCYLCPGNKRAEGAINPDYKSAWAFTNDFSALLSKVPVESMDQQGLLVAQTESGVCRVVCFSPRHDLTLSRMQTPEIENVIEVWTDEYKTLGSDPNINYVQIFENRGDIMGCSNPHPHCQIWASRSVPDIPASEDAHQAAWHSQKGRCLLCDYLKLELTEKSRLVCQNDEFVVIVPFWAVWPFETMVLPREHIGDLSGFTPALRSGFADILSRITRRYDQLFQTSFPYSMGIHQTPTDGKEHPGWHFHAHFLPPLLRSATVKKFMVGYELLARPQRDISPETTAERLRHCPEEQLS